jgi:hypothetical protein
MANTTFKGPVTSLNGFIGGPNVNAGDTQQGGKTPYTTTNSSTVTDGTNEFFALNNEGVLIYVQDGANGNPVYAFSDGTNWKRVDTLDNIDPNAGA